MCAIVVGMGVPLFIFHMNAWCQSVLYGRYIHASSLHLVGLQLVACHVWFMF
jgi:hypothetical protein